MAKENPNRMLAVCIEDGDYACTSYYNEEYKGFWWCGLENPTKWWERDDEIGLLPTSLTLKPLLPVKFLEYLDA